MRKFSRLVLSLGILSLASPAVFALCVREKEAKLRHGPSRKWPVTLEAIQYTPLQTLGKNSGWVRVKDVDGEIHWVKETLVTSGYKCVTIKEEFANLRTGPGMNFPKVPSGQGEKYLSFRLVSEKGEWVKVIDLEGDEAWVLKKLIWIQ